MAGPSHDPALYRERDVVPIRRALVSVSDKTDLLTLADALTAAGVEIVSTGGSASLLREAGHTVSDVSARLVARMTRRRDDGRRAASCAPPSSEPCSGRTSASSVGPGTPVQRTAPASASAQAVIRRPFIMDRQRGRAEKRFEGSLRLHQIDHPHPDPLPSGEGRERWGVGCLELAGGLW